MSSTTAILEAKQYFDVLKIVVDGLAHEGVDAIADELMIAYQEGRKVLLFGNGGSASLASHFACDLGKGTAYCNGGRRFRVIALTDNLPILTAWANDSSYEDVFSEQLRNFIEPDDIAFAVSGSGNSKNVLKALEVARDLGARTIGISGFDGGRMKSLCDVCVVVPCTDMQIIEDLHLAMAHALFRIVHARITDGAIATALAR